jgi:hypothetical protein
MRVKFSIWSSGHADIKPVYKLYAFIWLQLERASEEQGRGGNRLYGDRLVVGVGTQDVQFQCYP